MRTLTTTVYTYDELDEGARAKARDWYTQGMEYFWFEDSLASFKCFVDNFDAKIKDYSFGAFDRCYLTTDATNENFRGIKLKDFDRDMMPTGYCLDYALWATFFDVFQKTGDAKQAYEDAIDEAVKEVRRDMEYQYEEESIEENIRCNEYEFTIEGKRSFVI
jgi:hypothetical protein